MGTEKRVSRCEGDKSESEDWMGVGLRMTGSDGMRAFSRSSVEEFGVFGVELELLAFEQSRQQIKRAGV